MKIFSVDAEANGLHGKAFCVAAVARTDDGDIEFVARCPVPGQIEPWVAENVLPNIADIPVTHRSYETMLEGFWAFWMAHGDGAVAVTHCGVPVVSDLFKDCIALDASNRQFSGPSPLHEVGTMLLMQAEDPTGVDAYLALNGLQVPFAGASHHPLRDSWATAMAADSLLGLDRVPAPMRASRLSSITPD